ncbi:hypothetical protein BJX70DRAFT_360520 [Aspergillus crustosus]
METALTGSSVLRSSRSSPKLAYASTSGGLVTPEKVRLSSGPYRPPSARNSSWTFQIISAGNRISVAVSGSSDSYVTPTVVFDDRPIGSSTTQSSSPDWKTSNPSGRSSSVPGLLQLRTASGVRSTDLMQYPSDWKTGHVQFPVVQRGWISTSSVQIAR